jgi:type II secretory pathway component PulC
MGTLLFTLSNYTQNNSIEQAKSSAKTLESKIQVLEENSLRYARIIADNSNLVQAVFSKDTGTIAGILASAAQNSQADFVIVANQGGEALYSTLESFSLSGAAVQAGLTSAQSGGEATILDV